MALMSVQLRLYRKKPVTIIAVLFDGTQECGNEIIKWAESRIKDKQTPGVMWMSDIIHDATGIKYYWKIYIRTLEGVMSASPGDYIIEGINGEFYPCKPFIFKATYDKVDDASIIGSLSNPCVDQN